MVTKMERWLTWEESRVLDPCITAAIQNSISQSAACLIDGKLEEVQSVTQHLLNADALSLSFM